MDNVKLLHDSIQKIEISQSEENNAENILKEVSKKVLQIAQGGISAANTSDSIDKKIEILANSLGDVVAAVDDRLATIVEVNKKYKNQIAILEEVLGKLEQSQKKNDESE